MRSSTRRSGSRCLWNSPSQTLAASGSTPEPARRLLCTRTKVGCIEHLCIFATSLGIDDQLVYTQNTAVWTYQHIVKTVHVLCEQSDLYDALQKILIVGRLIGSHSILVGLGNISACKQCYKELHTSTTTILTVCLLGY